MATRKRWTKQEEGGLELEKLREKKKWQITLRRYVFQKNPCPAYAPYFGLDIENLRAWLQLQFTEGISWENFGKRWNLSHILPLSYFDLTIDRELRTCWNFINLKVEDLEKESVNTTGGQLNTARLYFTSLYQVFEYEPCLWMLEKIETISKGEILNNRAQKAFFIEKIQYLQQLNSYSTMEFEMLNVGRSIEDIEKEIELIRKLGQ